MEAYECINRVNICGLICDLFCFSFGPSLSAFMQSELRMTCNTSTCFSEWDCIQLGLSSGAKGAPHAREDFLGLHFIGEGEKWHPSSSKSSQLHSLQFLGYKTNLKIQFLKTFEDSA